MKAAEFAVIPVISGTQIAPALLKRRRRLALPQAHNGFLMSG
jgi:hypothetical protein